MTGPTFQSLLKLLELLITFGLFVPLPRTKDVYLVPSLLQETDEPPPKGWARPRGAVECMPYALQQRTAC